MLESAPVLSETTIREWAAEMFVALETLHRWGVTCQDLHPGNILLDENGHLLLTFQLYWRGVDSSISEEAITGLYAAPETTKIFPVTPAADWWSYGALLFQLLTGKVCTFLRFSRLGYGNISSFSSRSPRVIRVVSSVIL